MAAEIHFTLWIASVGQPLIPNMHDLLVAAVVHYISCGACTVGRVRGVARLIVVNCELQVKRGGGGGGKDIQNQEATTSVIPPCSALLCCRKLIAGDINNV
jgi:hypothetical protein